MKKKRIVKKRIQTSAKPKRSVKKTIKRSSVKKSSAKPKKLIFTQPNLLISYSPTHEKTALMESQSILENLGKKGYNFLRSETDGIFLINTSRVKAKMVKLNALAKKSPGLFDKTCYWIPIDVWCPANIKRMQEEIKILSKGIKDKDSWRLELRKRETDKSTSDLIKKLTEPVDKMNVDLISPDKIIWVEIVGDDAGISLLKKDEYLAIPKLK